MSIRILTYHSIRTPAKNEGLKGINVTPYRFFMQMLTLKLFGYKGMSLKELKPYLEGEKSGRVFGITFDDGYSNNLKEAAPILKKFNFTSTCFVIVNSIGLSNTWDEKFGVKQVKLMDQKELKKWIELGHEIGSHGLYHKKVSEMTSYEKKEQIKSSRGLLSKIIGEDVTCFCYPYGDYDEESSSLAKGEYDFSVTTNLGRNNSQTDKSLLFRIPVSYRTGLIRFIYKFFLKS